MFRRRRRTRSPSGGRQTEIGGAEQPDAHESEGLFGSRGYDGREWGDPEFFDRFRPDPEEESPEGAWPQEAEFTAGTVGGDEIGSGTAAAGGSPEDGPAVIGTLLSRKPRRGAVAAVGWTLAVLAAVSALYWWGPREWADTLPASGETVFEGGETWRLLTAMAAHADAIHLLSNAALLGWFIYLSFGAFGASLYPWCAVPAGALSLALTLEGYPPHLNVVGASGLLYLLAGSWLTLYVLVERRLSIWQRLLRVIGFSLVVLVPTSLRPEVSYRAHAIGLFIGICLGLAYFLARRDTIRSGERWEQDPDPFGPA